MAFYKQDIVDINLNTGNIFRSFLGHSIGFKNDDADRFGIRVFRDGEPVDLTGASCQAVFINPLGTNIALTSYGTVSGNVAYVTLPQACYDYEGQFTLSIQLVGGGVTGTMRIVDGMVVNTGASGTVAPTASVPTYQEILAVYADMQEDIADYESVVANQNDQINSLKSALVHKLIDTSYWESGTISGENGVNSPNANRIRTKEFITNAIGISPANGYSVMVLAYDPSNNNEYVGYYKNGSYIKELSANWISSDVYFTSLPGSYVYKVIAKNSSGSAVSVSDATNVPFIIVTDDTLTKANIPADAKKTGIELNSLKGAIGGVEERDLLLPSTRNSSTSNTVTFTWNADKTECTVNGTNSSSTNYAANYLFGVDTVMPNGIKAGGKYHVTVDSEAANVFLFFYIYVNGNFSTSINVNSDKDIVIPANATGMLAGIGLAKSGSASNVKVSNISLRKKTSVDIEPFNSVKKAVINADGVIPCVWEQGGIYTGTGLDYDSTKTIRTQIVQVVKGEEISLYNVPYGMSVIAHEYTNASTYSGVGSIQNNTYIPKTSYVRFRMLKSNNNDIDPSEAAVEFYTNTGYISERINAISEKTQEADNGCGVYEVNHKYIYRKACSYSTPGFYSDNTDRTTTELKAIPKEGMYVYTDGKIEYRLTFLKKSSSGLVAADDYEYAFTSSTNRDNFQIACVYYPYQDGVFYSITAKRTSSVEDIYKVHVFAGKINKTGGRIPNITPCILYGNNETEKISFYDNVKWGSVTSYARNYSFILPLKYVDKVIAQPPYSLTAEIHKIDNDEMDVECYATECAFVPSGYAGMAFGKSVIDLSQYDFEGYAIIGITPKTIPTISISGKSFKAEYFGFGLKYEDVFQNVFVSWKNNANVQYESGVNPVVYDNINTIFSIKVPEMKASQTNKGYASGQNGTIYPFPNMGECSLMWYNGANAANIPMMHVKPKSFITASKNRNSRMYDVYTPGGHTQNLYGAYCSGVSGLVIGSPLGLEAYSHVHRLLSNFDYRDYDGIDSIKPGDMIAIGDRITGSDDYGHVNYVTEVVTINGSVFCVNIVEGWPPFMRRSTYVNYEKYKNYSNTSGLFGYHGITVFDQYSSIVLARPHNSFIKSIREAYGSYKYEDYAVTEIMCDRGTDSVYCIGENMVLTITDSNISTFDVYVDNVFKRTISISSGTTSTDDDGNTVVTFTSGFVEEPGYTELKVSGTTKESFYVPKQRTITWADTLNDDGTRRYYFDKSEENDVNTAVDCSFWDGIAHRWVFITDHITETADTAYADVPYSFEIDGQSHLVVRIRVLRKTQYGTYWHWVLDPRNPTYKQKAGTHIE